MFNNHSQITKQNESSPLFASKVFTCHINIFSLNEVLVPVWILLASMSDFLVTILKLTLFLYIHSLRHSLISHTLSRFLIDMSQKKSGFQYILGKKYFLVDVVVVKVFQKLFSYSASLVQQF